MIVALTHSFSNPPAFGGSVRTFNILSQLSKYDATELIYPRSYFVKTKLLFENECYSSQFFGRAIRSGPIMSAVSSISTGDRTASVASSFAIFPLSYPLLLRRTLEKGFHNLRFLIFEHAYPYSVVRRRLAKKYSGQIIYDAHNVEYDHLVTDSAGFYRPVARSIFGIERQLCESSEAILVVSASDRLRLSQLYHLALNKIHVLPNGVDCEAIRPANSGDHTLTKRALDLANRPIVLFIGGAIKPNVDALYFIEDLASKLTGITFLIVGKVSMFSKNHKSNLVTMGEVSERRKNIALAAADVAINPVDQGTGTSLKMTEYLAAGLPIVTTPIGSRGMNLNKEAIISSREGFIECIKYIINNPQVGKEMGIAGRQLAMSFDWKNLVQSVWSEVLCKISMA